MPSAAANHRALARKVATLPERVVRAGAAAMSDAIIEELVAATHGDRILSGTTKGRRPRRTKLATTTTVSGGRAIATATVAASPRRGRAQWSWLESGTGIRVVGELTRKTTGPGGKHMSIGGIWRTGPWSAGSMPAKHVFSEGVTRGIPDAERAMEAEFRKVVR